MLNLSKFAKSFVKATKGVYKGSPRIYNIDRNIYISGYAEINAQATSPFSRIKVHKGLFTCDVTDVLPGDLIQDRVDSNKYIVMSVKDKYCGDASIYFDCALYYCNVSVDIARYSDTGTRDSFNRLLASTPTVLYTNVPVMTDLKNVTIQDTPDRPIEEDKLNLYIQAKFDVHISDRLITTDNILYKVETIDKSSLENIWICLVTKDDR